MRGSAGPAKRAQPRLIDKGTVVEMHDKAGHVAASRVDLVQRRQPLFFELIGCPAADDLWGRGVLGLLLEHSQRQRERGHTIPADLLRLGQPAADECVCASFRPGTIVRPPASIILVDGDFNRSSSRRAPIPTTLSPAIAIAWARGVFSSSVMIFAFSIIQSAFESCAVAATGSNVFAA